MQLGKYHHYKGQYYQVIGTALHTETREEMVLYQALYPVPELQDQYGDNPTFTRPRHDFEAIIEVDGIKRPRFQLVE